MTKFDMAYPLSKIEKTEQFLRDLWCGKEKTAFSAYSSEPVYRQVENMEEMVEKAAQNILSGAGLPGWNIPRFIADFGTVSTAAYWGGKVHKPVGGCKGIDPVIKSVEDVSKVYPEKPEGGDAEKAVAIWKAVSAKLGTDRLNCSMIDIQGPLNTAALLWEQGDFMVAMYNEPEVVHGLLEIITEHIIAIVKSMTERIKHISGPAWPYIWLPRDIGIGITEDYMPLISPELYKEFGIPYIERINNAFGGLFIHCCGSYKHQLENLKNSKINLLGLEFSYPYTDPAELFKTFGSSALFVPGLGPHGFKEFPEITDFIKYLARIKLPETRLWFILDPKSGGFLKQVEAVESMI